jgi:hypothetical protein
MRAQRLADIFNQQNFSLIAPSSESIHLLQLSMQVTSYDCFASWLKGSFHGCEIDAPTVDGSVNQDWAGSHAFDCPKIARIVVARNKNFIPSANARRTQNYFQRGCPAAR